jgi:DNA topoisomerase II
MVRNLPSSKDQSRESYDMYRSMYRYMPVIPMVLVNGAEGIGTGWSTTIPNYNPRDVIANTLRLLEGQEMVPMQPWYKGFKGTIQEIPSKTAGKSYLITGVITQVLAMMRKTQAG